MCLVASADPTIEIGLYVDDDWLPAGEAVSGLSGPVQFRVRLPHEVSPAPSAVYAVHTTDLADPWQIDYAYVTEDPSTHEWLYISPEYQTVDYPDGDWDVWCQIPYPEPPVGGGGDSVTPPDDSELASADGGAAVASWSPPPYGWPPGFPCADNGNNDLYAGPAGLTAVNLTVKSVTVDFGPYWWLFGESVGPLFTLIKSPFHLPDWRAELDPDGEEILGGQGTADVWLRMLAGPGGSVGSDGQFADAPCTAEGTFEDQPETGFYYREACPTETHSGDWASNISQCWWFEGDPAPAVTDYVFHGTRRATIQGRATLNVSATPMDDAYGWCRPFAEIPGIWGNYSVLTEPEAAYTRVACVYTVGFGGPSGLEFDHAGTHYLGFALKDNVVYHTQGRWTRPVVFAFTVPAATCLVDSQWGSLGSDVYGQLGNISPYGAMSRGSFYSDGCYDDDLSGLLDESAGAFAIEWALLSDDVVYVGVHGHEPADGGIWVGNESFWWSDVPYGLDQLRFGYISACHSAEDPGQNGDGIVQTMAAHGAQCAAGWNGTVSSSESGVYHDEKVFEYLAAAATVRQAFTLARAETVATYGEDPRWDNLLILGNEDQRIAPAFVAP